MTASLLGLFNNSAVAVWMIFIAGIILVVKGGDWFVDAASEIATKLRVPAFIIGATIVSVATTLPEMIVSAIAAKNGSVDMAVGNAVGSVTANTSMIMAIGMIAMSFACPRKKYLKQMLLLIASSVVLFVASIPDKLRIIGSVILFIIFVVFMALNVVSAKNEEEEAEEEGASIEKKGLLGNIAMFIVGSAAVIIGSDFMVDCGEKIAVDIFGVDPRIVAVTLIAVGTSLPELVTTITSIIKKNSSLSVGNIVGANIIDLTLILPICSIISGKELPVTGNCINLDLPVCMLVTLVAMIPLIIRQKNSKVQGAILLVLYVAYLVVTVINPQLNFIH